MRAVFKVFLVVSICLFFGCKNSPQNQNQSDTVPTPKPIIYDDSVSPSSGVDSEISVLRISPSGDDVQSDKQIVLQFNKGIAPLGEMGRTQNQIPLFFQPHVVCEWRWISADTLACQLKSDTALTLSTKYQLGVRSVEDKDSVESKTINFAVKRFMKEQGNKDGWVFTTLRPRISSYSFKEWLSPEIPSVIVYFTQQVESASIEKHLFFKTQDGKRVPAVLQASAADQPVEEKIQYATLKAAEALPQASPVTLVVEPGMKGAVGPEESIEDREVVKFYTHEMPRFLGVRCCTEENVESDSEPESEASDESGDEEDGEEGGSSQYCSGYFSGLTSQLLTTKNKANGAECNPQSPIALIFSAPVSKEAVAAALSMSPAVTKDQPLSALVDSFYGYANLQTPHRKGNEYSVTLPTGLTPSTEYTVDAESVSDMFGRSLEKPIHASFKTSSRLPRMVIDDGEFVLERDAQTHLPAIIQNIDSIDFDYDATTSKGTTSAKKKILVDNVKNVSYFFPIKIRDILGGSGFIQGSFTSSPEMRNNDTPVEKAYVGQVTPFHIEVKYGHFDSLVWVTDLASGAPVANAQVSVLSGPDITAIPDLKSRKFAQGVTDENGFLILPGSETLDPDLSLTRNRDTFYVVVQKGTDLGFVPMNWNFRTGGYQPSVSQYGYIRTWGMTPQGIYKLGDTVHYKIVVRNQNAQTLTPAPREGYSLHIIDPLGKEVHTEEHVSLSEFGTYASTFDVPQNGAVGLYEFKLKAHFAPPANTWSDEEKGGRTFSVMKLLIADFTPAPFKVSTEVKGKIFGYHDQVSTTISATMHAGGAFIVGKVRLQAKVKGKPFEDLPPVLSQFSFDTWKQRDADSEEYEDISSIDIHSSEGILDEKGNFTGYFEIPQMGVYYGNLFVEGSVEDDRGKRIANLSSQTFAGPKNFVGLRFTSWTQEVGKDAEVDLAVIDREKNIISGEKISVSITRTETTASRVKSEGNTYTTRYDSVEVPVSTCDLTSAKDPVACHFVPTKPGLHTVVAKIGEGEGEHQSKLATFVIGSGDLLWKGDEINSLELVPENNKLHLGDTAKILVKNPFPGAKALLTTERYGILSKKIITLDSAAPIIEIPVTEELIPGFTVGVSIFSPRVDKPVDEGSVDLGKPALRVGSTQILVSESSKELSVSVKPEQEKYKPRETVQGVVHVDGANGQPIEVAVAVLDEAVFDLILQGREYFNPLKQLYALDESSVSTFDNLIRLIGRRNYLKKGANSGGDGLSSDSRNNLRYVAYWNPNLTLDSQGNGSFSFVAPDNLTAWRIFAVALNQTDHMGLGEGKVAVSKELEIRPNMPNQVAEGDTFTGEFTVLNRTDKTRKLTVTITSKDNPTAQIEKQIQLKSFERGVVGIPLAPTSEGTIALQANVTDGEFSDSLTHSLNVKRKAVIESAALYGSVDAAPLEQQLQFPGNIRPDLGGLKINLSPTVLGGLTPAFKYIKEYPYLCWEQRLTKGLLAAQYKTLAPYIPDLQWSDAPAIPEQMLKDAAAFQAPSGGMTYFIAKDEYVDPYLSAFTSLGFNWMRADGFTPLKSVEDKLDAYLVKFLKNDSAPSFYSLGMASTARAVILAALSEKQKITIAEVKRYKEAVPQMSLFGKAMYFKALQNYPNTDKEQKEMRDMLLSTAHETGGKLSFQETIDTNMFERILTTPTRDNCVVSEALLSKDANLAQKIIRSIAETRKQSGYWLNTQENLFCAHAMSKYAKLYEKTEPSGTWNVLLNKEKIGEAALAGFSAPVSSISRPMRAEDVGRSATLEVSKDAQAKGRAYVQAIMSFAPTELKKESINSGIEIRKEYSIERNHVYELLKEGEPVSRGDTIRVDLYLSLPAARNFVVVDDPVPGGFEPVNTDLKTASTFDAEHGESPLSGGAYWYRMNDWIDFASSRWSFYHRELKFDAARFYSEYLAPGNYHLSYVVQAIAPGEFVSLPARAEEMYDPDVFGQTEPGKVVIH